MQKTGDFEIVNDIGQIFQKHNIMEYKSENDSLNEDTYFKVRHTHICTKAVKNM